MWCCAGDEGFVALRSPSLGANGTLSNGRRSMTRRCPPAPISSSRRHRRMWAIHLTKRVSFRLVEWTRYAQPRALLADQRMHLSDGQSLRVLINGGD